MKMLFISTQDGIFSRWEKTAFILFMTQGGRLKIFWVDAESESGTWSPYMWLYLIYYPTFSDDFISEMPNFVCEGVSKAC